MFTTENEGQTSDIFDGESKSLTRSTSVEVRKHDFKTLKDRYIAWKAKIGGRHKASMT